MREAVWGFGGGAFSMEVHVWQPSHDLWNASRALSADSPKVSLGIFFFTKCSKFQKGLHMFFLCCCSQLTHVGGHLQSVFLVVYGRVGDVSFKWQLVLMLAYNTSL